MNVSKSFTKVFGFMVLMALAGLFVIRPSDSIAADGRLKPVQTTPEKIQVALPDLLIVEITVNGKSSGVMIPGGQAAKLNCTGKNAGGPVEGNFIVELFDTDEKNQQTKVSSQVFPGSKAQGFASSYDYKPEIYGTHTFACNVFIKTKTNKNADSQPGNNMKKIAYFYAKSVTTPPDTSAISTKPVADSMSIYVPVVTPSAGKGGTISPSTPQKVLKSNENIGMVHFTISADEGYYASVGGTCGGGLTGPKYITNKVTKDCTVSVTFVKPIVTPSAGNGGIILPSSPQTVKYGVKNHGILSFTVTPNEGYYASVGGTCDGDLIGTTYTTNFITKDCTVAAKFAKPVVTPSAGKGGTILPSTLTPVNFDKQFDFKLITDAGYDIASVGGTCDGKLIDDFYRTKPIKADCTVLASFKQSAHTVTPSASKGGKISPSTPQQLLYGETFNINLTPEKGNKATVSGTCGGSLGFGKVSYITVPITKSCTVIVSFQESGKYVDNGDGTVKDKTTGLTWQQGHSEHVDWYYASGTESKLNKNSPIKGYCSALSLAGGGWHLPTINELKSIIEPNSHPTIDKDFFPNTDGGYWSSTNSEFFASYVHFGDGKEYILGRKSPTNGVQAGWFSVRCVRG